MEFYNLTLFLGGKYMTESKACSNARFAIRSGNIKALRYCLENELIGKEFNKHRAELLATAAVDGTPDMIRLVLWYGANVDERTPYGTTPLAEAIISNKCENVMALVMRGDKPNLKDYRGNEPLYLAIREGYFDIAEWLIKNGGMYNITEHGIEPIMQWANLPESFVKLLPQAGVDVNWREGVDCEPLLFFAIEKGDDKIVDTLLRIGADPNITDVNGANALHCATKCQNPSQKIVRRLIKANVLLNTKDNFGNTPMHYCVKSYCNKDKLLMILNILLEAGSSSKIQNNKGETSREIYYKRNLVIGGNSTQDGVKNVGDVFSWYEC